MKVRAVRNGSPSPLSGAPAAAEPKRERATISAPAAPRTIAPTSSELHLHKPAPTSSQPAARGRKPAPPLLSATSEGGRTGGKGEGVVKCDTLRRRSPPSRCRTCRPSRRSLLRVDGSELGALMGWVKQRGDTISDTPLRASAATSKPALAVALCLPKEGRSPKPSPSNAGGQSMRGLFEPSPLSEDDGSRRDQSGRVNSSGDIFYKNL